MDILLWLCSTCALFGCLRNTLCSYLDTAIIYHLLLLLLECKSAMSIILIIVHVFVGHRRHTDRRTMCTIVAAGSKYGSTEGGDLSKIECQNLCHSSSYVNLIHRLSPFDKSFLDVVLNLAGKCWIRLLFIRLLFMFLSPAMHDDVQLAPGPRQHQYHYHYHYDTP